MIYIPFEHTTGPTQSEIKERWKGKTRDSRVDLSSRELEARSDDSPLMRYLELWKKYSMANTYNHGSRSEDLCTGAGKAKITH